ncbi:MAG: DUF2284 domain-containing protein [Spirochaetota bacterium]|nr:MAG: DUF2284 domain-containing protein [Spirochaetota bacterium]
MQNYEKYITRSEDLGAKDAKIIPVSTIVTAEWVRFKCQFGCGGYGKTLTCPPYSPTPEQTMRALSSYEHAIILHGNRYTHISDIVATLEREIFLDGFHKSFGMGSGPCNLCDRCPKLCRYPYSARPSMEACGIDVYSTARNTGFPIEVVTNTNCECNYYGVVFIE